MDTLGNLLYVKVHAANQSDTKVGCAVFEQTTRKYPSLKAFSADQGYCGTLLEFVEKVLGLKLDIAKGIKGHWVLLKKRWVVERTFALALELGVSARRINEIVSKKRRITADTALRLARYFSMSPQFWLGLQMDYELDIAEDDLADRLEQEVQVHAASG